jgi:hypothetical protein
VNFLLGTIALQVNVLVKLMYLESRGLIMEALLLRLAITLKLMRSG